MSPIDDELRTALSSHADPVGLSPDFFSGVERRARGLRRRKVAATVAGSALAVSALGLGGPVVASLLSSTPSTAPSDVARPTLVPSPQPPAADRYVLDPASPWAYRGDPALAVQGDVDAYEVQWGAVHGQRVDDFVLTPLFGQVFEPSATPEVVYLVTTSAGEHWWGVAQATESGPELLLDVELAEDTAALLAALPGDEGPRLLGVAAPGTSLQYGPGPATRWTDMAELADGVGTTALDGDEAADQVRVLGPDGEPVAMLAAPSAAGSVDPDASPAPGGPEQEGPGTETPPAPTSPPDTELAEAEARALDPASPWAFRGDAEVRAAIAKPVWYAWLAALGQGEPGSSDATALWAGSVEADGRGVVVLVARQTDRSPWYVVSGQETSGGGVELLDARPLGTDQHVVDVWLLGGEGMYLLGLSDPGTTLRWSQDGSPEGAARGEGGPGGVAVVHSAAEPGTLWYVRANDGAEQTEEPDTRPNAG